MWYSDKQARKEWCRWKRCKAADSCSWEAVISSSLSKGRAISRVVLQSKDLFVYSYNYFCECQNKGNTYESGTWSETVGALEEMTRMESPRQTSQRRSMQGRSRAELSTCSTPHPRKRNKLYVAQWGISRQVAAVQTQPGNLVHTNWTQLKCHLTQKGNLMHEMRNMNDQRLIRHHCWRKIERMMHAKLREKNEERTWWTLKWISCFQAHGESNRFNSSKNRNIEIHILEKLWFSRAI